MTHRADAFEVNCFHFTPGGDEVVCRFTTPLDREAQPAGELEKDLCDEFRPGGRLAGRTLIISLDGVPAISSRQLGALLSLHRAAFGEGDEQVQVRGAGPNIRNLFEQAQMSRFFTY